MKITATPTPEPVRGADLPIGKLARIRHHGQWDGAYCIKDNTRLIAFNSKGMDTWDFMPDSFLYDILPVGHSVVLTQE